MQMLENDISRLQNRVRELESANPPSARASAPPPSSQNVPDLIPDLKSPSTSSAESSVATPYTMASSYTPSIEMTADMSPPTPTIEPEPQWWQREHPPEDISNML